MSEPTIRVDEADQALVAAEDEVDEILSDVTKKGLRQTLSSGYATLLLAKAVLASARAIETRLFDLGEVLAEIRDKDLMIEIPQPDLRGLNAYDEQGHYLFTNDRRSDPAWPGITPEPEVMHVVFAGDAPIPCARSFVEHAEPRHYDQIRRMLEALPHRTLTRVVGYGDAYEGNWRAFNEGADGHGDWTITRDLTERTR